MDIFDEDDRYEEAKAIVLPRDYVEEDYLALAMVISNYEARDYIERMVEEGLLTPLCGNGRYYTIE